jgi:hypothetical protein
MLLFTFALLCVGGLVALISGVWTLALAFQRHLLWGLAVLLVPVGGNIAFLFVNWREARVPFLLGLVSAILMVSAFSTVPPETFANPLRSAFAAVQEDQAMQQAIADRDMAAERQQGELEMRLANIKQQESVLQQRKALLRPHDQEGAEALSMEIRKYNAELQPLLAELKSRDR